ncbi:MAG: hypothetical protein ABIT04_02090 [Novosphingobium sp.]
MKKAFIPLVGLAAFAAMAPAAAFAHGRLQVIIGGGSGYDGYDGYGRYGYGSQHGAEHEALDEEHADVHDQLDEEHAEAHEEGLTPWDHARLHAQLRGQHYYADRQVARQHSRFHQRQWQPGGYYQYYGY